MGLRKGKPKHQSSSRNACGETGWRNLDVGRDEEGKRGTYKRTRREKVEGKVKRSAHTVAGADNLGTGQAEEPILGKKLRVKL